MEDSIKKELEDSKFSLQLWKTLLSYLKPFRSELIKIAICMVLLALIDTLIPLLTQIAIDNYIMKNNFDGIAGYIAMYMLAAGALSLTIYAFHVYGGRVDAGVIRMLRRHAFEHLQKLPFAYYDKTAVGWMIARLTSDVGKLGDMMAWGLVDLIWGAVLIVFITIAMLIINIKLALLTLLVVPLIAIVSFYFQDKILKTSRLVRKVNSKITGAFNEGITGAKATKSLVSEDSQFEGFSELTHLFERKSYRLAIYSGVYLPILLTLGSISMALLLNYGGVEVARGAVSFGTLVLFTHYAVQFFEPMRELARIYAELQTAQASAERIISLIETPLDLKDSPHVIAKYGDAFEPKRDNWETFNGKIQFKAVNFHYLPDEPVLTDFNLTVLPSQKVALVGETGSGKSTVVNLACRFYEPISGEVLLDDRDYRERSQLWLHEQIGYVLQTPHLFSGTIKDNIRYGKANATDDEIIAAAKLTNAHQFIIKLDAGYDTQVGEGGAMLSTGEKQLISFARAVIKNPKLFVLDEATSSIDTETEKLIQDAIDHVLKNRTSFIIAHRLSTIKSADIIIVMKKGCIVEQGDHVSLMQLKGYYYQLYTHQFINEAEVSTINQQ